VRMCSWDHVLIVEARVAPPLLHMRDHVRMGGG